MSTATAANDATLFPPRETELYVERTPLGLPGPAFQGASFFTASNTPFGAVFTYHLKDEVKSLRKQRWEEEAKLEKDGSNEPGKPADKSDRQISIPYPTWEQFRSEQRELEPAVVLVVSDDDGNIIRRVTGPVTSGFHRVAWDLRYPPPSPIELNPEEPDQFANADPGTAGRTRHLQRAPRQTHRRRRDDARTTADLHRRPALSVVDDRRRPRQDARVPETRLAPAESDHGRGESERRSARARSAHPHRPRSNRRT